jgi:hypothetical protein
MQRSTLWFCAMTVLALSSPAFGKEYRPPKEVKVLPVFFVPKGESSPTARQLTNLQKHTIWTQTRYKQLLKGRDTFALAERKPQVYLAEHDVAYYRAQSEGAAPQIVDELLRHYKYNRYNCPLIFVAIVMNPHEDYPGGGARPFNGGINTGGGIVEMSSYGLDRAPNFQSTLQHELGHAFGLPHVDVYGYDMGANPSLMSYNPAHHTEGFQPSKTPGILIAEDFRALALNRRVFPRLRFDPKKDVPQGYAMQPIVTLGPMNIPGHPLIRSATPPDAYSTRHFITTLQTSAAPSGKSVANPGA